MWPRVGAGDNKSHIFFSSWPRLPHRPQGDEIVSFAVPGPSEGPEKTRFFQNLTLEKRPRHQPKNSSSSSAVASGVHMQGCPYKAQRRGPDEIRKWDTLWRNETSKMCHARRTHQALLFPKSNDRCTCIAAYRPKQNLGSEHRENRKRHTQFLGFGGRALRNQWGANALD